MFTVIQVINVTIDPMNKYHREIWWDQFWLEYKIESYGIHCSIRVDRIVTRETFLLTIIVVRCKLYHNLTGISVCLTYIQAQNKEKGTK